MFHLIGVYDYTVILTYISLVTSVFGITQAFQGHCTAAVACLALSGVFDAFDGRIARTKKDRTEDEKAFGIQIDSLCDVVCFGVLPASIGYALGMRGILGLTLVMGFCLCAVIRLAFFNVLEGKRQQSEGGSNKTYRGLPVTSIAFILPMTFLLKYLIPAGVFLILLHAVMAVAGFLFVLDVPIPKPGLRTILVLIGTGLVTACLVFAWSRSRLVRAAMLLT